jgi:hypothetical protein
MALDWKSLPGTNAIIEPIQKYEENKVLGIFQTVRRSLSVRNTLAYLAHL